MRGSRWLALLTLVAGLGLFGSERAGGASDLRWKLILSPEITAPRNPVGRLVVKPPKGGEQVYWYVVYTITNTHDEAVALNLNAVAATDASDAQFNEGFYPRALAKIRQRFGDDVKDCIKLNGFMLEPGASARAVAVFRLFQTGAEGEQKSFEERVDRLTVKFDGVCDPVKRNGLEFTVENVQLWMKFRKVGDQFEPGREWVRFVGSEEKVIGG